VGSGAGPSTLARKLFPGLGPRYDALGALLSLGQDRRWRREAVSRVVADAGPDGVVLDVATGTAGLALQITARSGARVVGVDLTEGMLRQGVANVARAGAGGRVSLVRARAEQLPFRDGTFSGLTFSYLLRYVDDPAATVAEMSRVIRPGAPMASLEFHVPPRPFWRAWWWGYTRLVLPLGGLLTGGREWLRVGWFLGPNITGHYRRYPLEWTVQAWRAAGLADVGTRLMSLGGGLVMWGRKT
jgi:demethylmenaquinone methyltransferase/2-methoxy-6-polyprenyl-1,4-benzoquinol methylase